jgi:hypothetical protein
VLFYCTISAAFEIIDAFEKPSKVYECHTAHGNVRYPGDFVAMEMIASTPAIAYSPAISPKKNGRPVRRRPDTWYNPFVGIPTTYFGFPTRR